MKKRIALLLSLVMLVMCASVALAEGTYTGTALGRNGDVTVRPPGDRGHRHHRHRRPA